MIHTIEIPYSMSLSKNQSHGYGKDKLWTNPATKAEMNAISYLCMSTRGAWIRAKKSVNTPVITVHIHVRRPNMLGDPVNFMDAILDGIKVGIGIDDNVYECATTWELDKANPGIVITISQGE